MAASYTNPGGTGGRRFAITVTQVGTSLFKSFNGYRFVDGDLVTQETYTWTNGVAGLWLKFEFIETVQITEATWYQSNTNSHGVWQWQGSNDDNEWTSIGDTFTLGGSTAQVQTTLSGNTERYRYYRILGISGNETATTYLLEVEFKIDGLSEDASYLNPLGVGDREITASSSEGLLNTGTAADLVDGNINTTDFVSGPAANHWFKFDFGLPQIIIETQFYESVGTTHGVWKWQGSHNDSDWIDAGGTFTLGGATKNVDTSLAGNEIAYRYYRLLGVSGNVSTTPSLYEFQFKLVESSITPLSIAVADDLNNYSDAFLFIWPSEINIDDDLDNWGDQKTFEETTTNFEVFDDLNIWDDAAERGVIDYFLEISDDLNNFDDEIQLFSIFSLLVNDTLNLWQDSAIRIIPLRRTVSITDSFSGSRAGQATNRTTFRDGFSLLSFGASILFITDDVNQWTDFVDADSIETLIGVNSGSGDLFFLIDNVKLLLNYFLSRNDRLELADEFNQGAGGNPEQADDLNLWNDLAEIFIPLELDGISVADSLNNWLDIIIILLSTSIQSYIRRYLNDVINNDIEHPTLIEFPVRDPAMILYLRRYLNDVSPDIHLDIDSELGLEDSLDNESNVEFAASIEIGVEEGMSMGDA